MYAIIATGGKQYRVEEGDVIDVDLLKKEEGEPVQFSEVLLLHDGKNVHVGGPVVGGATVAGEVMGRSVGPKIKAMKYRPRGHQAKRWGHRQHYTRVKILEIASAGK